MKSKRRKKYYTIEEIEEEKKYDLRLNGYRLSDCQLALKNRNPSHLKDKYCSYRGYPDHRFILVVLDKETIELTMPTAIYGYLLQEEILPTKSKSFPIELTRKDRLVGYFELSDILYSDDFDTLVHVNLKILNSFDINILDQKLLELDRTE